jgi:hypothetical protein
MRATVSSGHLICTKLDVAGINNAGVQHGRLHAGRDLIDLLQAAEVLEWKLRRVSAANCQSRPFAIGTFAALEHNPVRCHATLGAARHDKTDLLGLLYREIAQKQKLQRERRETAAEIVDEAVALGLAKNRDHVLRIDALASNRGLNA